MKTCFAPLLMAAVLLPAAAASALDQIKTDKALVSGTITEVGKFEVKIKRSSGEEESYPVNEIDYIRFDGESSIPQLNLIRSHVLGGRYNDALAALEKIAPDGVDRLEIKQEIEFFKAISSARLAIAGAADAREAGTLMNNFVKNNPGSYHFLEATEAVGDLLVTLGSFANAVPYYEALEQAPWPDTKMRGAVAKGKALMGEQKFAEAQTVFDAAIALAADNASELVTTQKQAATIGKASCMAAGGQFDQGIKMLEDVVANANPEDMALHAAAYNALGGCYRQADRPKDALLAYLHVDLLYNSLPLAHAEALYNLKDVWKAVGDTDGRALQAEQLLTNRYGNTAWAKK